jgi:hypothetical protein
MDMEFLEELANEIFDGMSWINIANIKDKTIKEDIRENFLIGLGVPYIYHKSIWNDYIRDSYYPDEVIEENERAIKRFKSLLPKIKITVKFRINKI